MPELKERVHEALQDDFLRKSVKFTVDRLKAGKQKASEKLGQWETWRERARQVRAHTVANLDHYLGRFSANVEKAGGKVFFAADAAEAVAEVQRIALAQDARLVVKSKSMVSEEIHLNRHLQAAGVECVETDLGEWIIQLAGQTPSHIILPAIHKTRGQIRKLFEAHGGQPLSDETPVLAGYARKVLRRKFRQADIGLSGCNFGIAETGSVVLFTNEGNGRLVTGLPRTHVVVMGMERLLPSFADLELMANMLPRSATGQKLTTYMTVVTGPRKQGELDGPENLHVIVVDNGRSAQLGDPEFQDLLNCIRCGACLNVCPVYRQVGGHAYGSTYSGPIGAVLTPLLQPDKSKWGEVANASSLCGACDEACPVKIPLESMLVHLRRKNAEGGRTPLTERLAFKAFGRTFSSPQRIRLLAKMIRLVRRWGGDHFAPRGWTKARNLPGQPEKTFREMWDETGGRF
jgi:L-lactate dehydrogenase complex protein LldF